MSAGRGVVTSRPRRVGRCGGSGSGAGNSPGNSGSGSGTGSAGSAANGGNSGSAAMEYVSPEQLAGFSKYKGRRGSQQGPSWCSCRGPCGRGCPGTISARPPGSSQCHEWPHSWDHAAGSEDDVPVDVPEPVGAEEMNSAVGHQQNQPL
ncbi:uncharacterized protein FYW23_015858 isoform 2-T2 [Sylvia borin]